MPKYREWDRDPEEYRPQPNRLPNQRRRQWDDEDYYNDKQDDDYDDRDDYRDQR